MALTVTMVEEDDIMAMFKNGEMKWFRVEYEQYRVRLVEMSDNEVEDWHLHKKAVV